MSFHVKSLDENIAKVGNLEKRINKLEKRSHAEQQDSVMSTRPKDTNATSEEPKGAGPYNPVLKNVSGVGTLVRSNDSNLFLSR